MRNEAVVYVSGGVELGSILDTESLARLAIWLCQAKEYHEIKKGPHKCGAQCRVCNEFESQQKRNGGYCDCCEGFAGELLAHFDLKDKAVSA